MAISSLSKNGEVKIPSEMLGILRLRVGDKVELRIERDGSLRLFPKRRTVAEVKGMFAARTKVSATVEMMDDAVAEGFKTGNL